MSNVNISAKGDVEIGGDVVGRDKITYEAAAPIATSLHQLPPPRDFTGRVAELAELMTAIDKGGATISGLQGLGGVGKTALALKLAEQLTPRYPDAQFYLDLKGVAKKPMSLADAMAHVIRAYYPTSKLPESEAELSALYQSVLHSQRAPADGQREGQGTGRAAHPTADVRHARHLAPTFHAARIVRQEPRLAAA